MSYVERHAVTILTSTGGVGTGYTPVVTGEIIEVGYVKSTLAYTSTFDLAVIGEDSGKNIWSASDIGNASKVVSPQQPIHTQAGVAIDYATGAGAPVHGPIKVAHERVKITVTSGGASKSGQFVIIVA